MSRVSIDGMTIVELLDRALSELQTARGLILARIEDPQGLAADELQAPVDHLTGAKNLNRQRRNKEAANHARIASNECHAFAKKYRALAFKELSEARAAASLAAGRLADDSF